MKKFIILFSFLQIWFPAIIFCIDKLAILVVIDGLSYDIFQKAQPYFSGGFKDVMQNGIAFNNAHFQYAGTSTGPGHATISTGCWPNVHGIVDNAWYAYDGTKIHCDQDGSPANIMTDGIADQLALADKNNSTIAIGNKTRATVCMATRLGKALWFDANKQQIVSSKAYFEQLPAWAHQLNNYFAPKKSLSWISFFPLHHKAYSFADSSYEYAEKPSIINKDLLFTTHKKYFKQFPRTPYASEAFLQCAREILKVYQNKNNVLLCVALDNLDKVGHIYGPDSYEYIDTVYHLDNQLKKFFDWVNNDIKPRKLLLCITADHGNFSIPELLDEQGFTLAQRIIAPQLEQELNEFINKHYGIDQVILKIDSPSIYFNRQKLNTLEINKQKALLADIQKKLKTHPGIKEVWTLEELTKTCSMPYDFVTYFKNQIFQQRNGLLQCQLFPYTFISKIPQGTSHSSPYNYTTHVPLLIFNSDKKNAEEINHKIWMTQVAPTLAHFFNIAKPSACLQNALSVF